MSEGKKLYEVTVTVTYYAYTETPDSAADYATDAVNDTDFYLRDSTYIKEVKSRPYRLAPGWDDGNLVYCHGFDTTLGEALATLPEKEPLR